MKHTLQSKMLEYSWLAGKDNTALIIGTDPSNTVAQSLPQYIT